MNKHTLYITFDGLSDPLGQSQILPYLRRVAEGGFRIHILSCEKEERLEKEKQTLLSFIGTLPITWEYILYDADGGFLSRFNYVRRLRGMAERVCRDKKISLVHCRSYLASLIGLRLKQKHDIPFLFDMRGFWADERIDGGIWKKNNPLHAFFYSYFKKKEKQFLLQSDAIVSLTYAAVKELEKNYPTGDLNSRTTVIPCCTDTDLFHKEAVETPLTLPGSSKQDHLLVYTGSIGTWYYTRELIDCVLAWKELIPEIKLLILTKDTSELNTVLATYTSEQRNTVLTASCSYKDVAKYLVMAKAALFFIKPSVSKIASSPTKMAECWSMDLPIITNSGIGDNDLYFKNRNGGVLIESFTRESYVAACLAYQALPRERGFYRNIALDDFDVKSGSEKYIAIYQKLTGS